MKEIHNITKRDRERDKETYKKSDTYRGRDRSIPRQTEKVDYAWCPYLL
jgi:hypothetical protein